MGRHYVKWRLFGLPVKASVISAKLFYVESGCHWDWLLPFATWLCRLRIIRQLSLAIPPCAIKTSVAMPKEQKWRTEFFDAGLCADLGSKEEETLHILAWFRNISSSFFAKRSLTSSDILPSSLLLSRKKHRETKYRLINCSEFSDWCYRLTRTVGRKTVRLNDKCLGLLSHTRARDTRAHARTHTWTESSLSTNLTDDTLAD